jgi:hypothetical protein
MEGRLLHPYKALRRDVKHVMEARHGSPLKENVAEQQCRAVLGAK